MKKKKAYEITFEIVDFLEQQISKRDSRSHQIMDIFNEPVIFFSTEFPKIKTFFSPFTWVYKQLVRPFYIIKSGFIKLLDKIILKMFVSGILIFIIPLYFFSENLNSKDIFILTIVTYSFWTVSAFFSFNYGYTSKEQQNIEVISEKLKPLSRNKIKAIQNHIQILKIKFNKEIILLNSILSFIWAITFIIIRSYDIKLFLIKDNYFVFGVLTLFFLFVLMLIRAYSKIYNHIFEIANIACEETLIIDKKAVISTIYNRS